MIEKVLNAINRNRPEQEIKGMLHALPPLVALTYKNDKQARFFRTTFLFIECGDYFIYINHRK